MGHILSPFRASRNHFFEHRSDDLGGSRNTYTSRGYFRTDRSQEGKMPRVRYYHLYFLGHCGSSRASHDRDKFDHQRDPRLAVYHLSLIKKVALASDFFD